MASARPAIAAWPAWLDEQDARRYLSLNSQQFRAAQAAGFLPQGREIVPGAPRWLRVELDMISLHLFEIRDELTHDAARQDANEALAAFKAETRRAAA